MNCIKPACDAQDPLFCGCAPIPKQSEMLARKYDRPTRPAKGSELIALQRRINRKYGHPTV